MVEVWLIFNFLLSSLAVNVGTFLFYWKMTVPCRGLFKAMSKIDGQEQPSRGVLRKRCSENIQQSYRRTPMPKGVSIKVQSNTALVLEIGCRFGYLTAI